MFGIAAAIYVYCTYVFVENKNMRPERQKLKKSDCQHSVHQIYNHYDHIDIVSSDWVYKVVNIFVHFIQIVWLFNTKWIE